jgi:hypothetical protein
MKNDDANNTESEVEKLRSNKEINFGPLEF